MLVSALPLNESCRDFAIYLDNDVSRIYGSLFISPLCVSLSYRLSLVCICTPAYLTVA